jgi:hypothetical protein
MHLQLSSTEVHTGRRYNTFDILCISWHLGAGSGDGAAVLPLHIEASHKGMRALAKDVVDGHDAVLAWHYLTAGIRSRVSACR